MKQRFQMIFYPYERVLTIIVLVLLVVIILTNTKTFKDTSSITINNRPITIELAKTESERRQGLSDRESLSDDTGLLFVFPTKDYYSFWNYHLKFPIDVLWINDNTIVDKTSFPIDSGQPITYRPKAQANYVVEVNAGIADRNDWSIGQGVILPKSLR